MPMVRMVRASVTRAGQRLGHALEHHRERARRLQHLGGVQQALAVLAASLHPVAFDSITDAGAGPAAASPGCRRGPQVARPGAARSPFVDAFDDVIAALVLHYLEDWGAAAELRRRAEAW